MTNLNIYEKERPIIKKIKEKKAGTGLIIVLTLVIVLFTAIIPADVNNVNTHILSKKLKTHINAMCNSCCLIIPTINEDGSYTQDVVAGETSTCTFFKTLFNTEFNKITTQNSADKYITSYESNDKKIAFQYCVYNATTTKSKKPDYIDNVISENSKGNKVDVSQIKDSVYSKKPTVVIIVRYDVKMMDGSIKSMIRYGSSKINFSTLN